MKTLFILEDNEDMVFLMRKKFSERYEVKVFKDGLSLIAEAAKRQLVPDLVLLDMMVPGRSGYELLNPLRCAWPNSRIFVYSAHGEYRKRIPPGMIDGFFLKTDDIQDLEAAMSRSLGGT